MNQTRSDLLRTLDQWVPHSSLGRLVPVAIGALIFDTVWRVIGVFQLPGYWTAIGSFYAMLKLISFLGGIVANAAVFRRQKWGVAVGVGAAAIGLWLLAMDLWSLFHVAFGQGFVRVGNFVVVRATIKTLAHGVWLALYLAALVVMLQYLTVKDQSVHSPPRF
jgi:hypothetical protein